MVEKIKIIGKEFLVGMFLKQYIGKVAYKLRLNIIDTQHTNTYNSKKRVCLEKNQFIKRPTFYVYKFS